MVVSDGCAAIELLPNVWVIVVKVVHNINSTVIQTRRDVNYVTVCVAVVMEPEQKAGGQEPNTSNNEDGECDANFCLLLYVYHMLFIIVTLKLP